MPDYNKKAASMQRWPFCFHCLVRVSVDTFPKVVMKNESEPRAWRSQRDHGLPVKLAVVGEVGRGEWSCKQAQRRYATHLPAPPALGGRGPTRRAGLGAGAGRAHPVAAAGHAQAAPENRPVAAGAGRGLRARCLVHLVALPGPTRCPQAQLYKNDKRLPPLPLPPQLSERGPQTHGPESIMGQ